MGIEIGLEHSNPIDVGVNMMIKTWVGFIKIHLRLPHMDGIALFKGERAFVTEMENNAKEIGKVEKKFEFITKAKNLRLKGDTLHDNYARTIFQEIMKENFYKG